MSDASLNQPEIENDEEVVSYWLASYPRSGNTLARITLSQALLPNTQQPFLEKNFPSLDISQSVPEEKSKKPLRESVRTPLTAQTGTSFIGTRGRVRFVKTHWCSPDIMDLIPSIGGAYFVRHPLDVFLSGLNYIYVNAPTVESFKNYFLRSEPIAVGEIIERDEMMHYLNNFMDNAGFWPFQFGSGTWTESVKNWVSASQTRNIKVVPYWTFVNQRRDMLSEISTAAGLELTADQIARGVEGGEAATKPDGKFFWRGGSEVRQKIPVDKMKELQWRMFSQAGMENIPEGFASY